MRLDGKIRYDDCTECGENKPIAHQKKCLCLACNQKRLSNRKKESPKDKPTLKRLKETYSVKRISEKEKSIKARLREVYREIDEKAMREGKAYCWSCGSSRFPLSHSHRISRGQRKDLETDPDNIDLECMSIGDHVGCHNIWEHGSLSQKQKLKTFNDKMKYIKKMDEKCYNKILRNV